MATQAAPGDLEIVRAFLNTLDVEDGIDRLADPASAAGWLRECALLGAGADVGEDGAAALRSLRDALRAAVAAGEALPDDALAELNRAAAAAGLAVRFGPGPAPRFEPAAGGAAGAAGRLLAIVARSMTEGTFPRLKLCDNDRCAWAFYDHSRNRSGRWCTMAVCGNRMKARAFRQRQG